MLVLDINDTEVTLTGDDEVLYAEPGVAFVGREGTLFGNEALAQSRLHPHQSHNEFWHLLNADPVASPAPGVANQADLVYLHLQAIRAAAGIHDRAEVVVAASAASKPEQLAMLLGIAVEAGFDVRAIVDAAVAAACRQDATGPRRLLDIYQHRAIVTNLELAGEVATPQLRRGTADEVPAAGFATLVEGWVDTVADRFVDATRFDPLRIAQSEQQVFDQVLAGINADEAEFAIAVQHDGVARHVSVPRRAFAEKSEQRFALLVRALGAPGGLAITHRVRKVPGLAAALQTAGHELRVLPANAVAAGVGAHAERIPTVQPGRGARLVTSLPLPGQKASRATAISPTHLLCGSTAIALRADTNARNHPAGTGGTAMFHVKRDRDAVVLVPDADATVTLNGARVDFDHPLAAGDVVVCGTDEFTLIVVDEPPR